MHWSLKVDGVASDTVINVIGGGVHMGSEWTLTGTLDSNGQEAGHYVVSFRRLYLDDRTLLIYEGIFKPDTLTLSAKFYQEDSPDYNGTIFLKRTPNPHVMCYRWPLEEKLSPSALWKFACSAVLNDVRKRQFRMRFIYERLTYIYKWITLTYRDNQSLLSPEEVSELQSLRKLFSPLEYQTINALLEWYG
jgi:hypothetical protein